MIRRNRYEVTFSPKSYADQISTDSADSNPQSPLKSKYNNKEKLQLCRNFLQNGLCPYKNRCKFAHGSHQLRKDNEANKLYKTKQCVAFFRQGCCNYGERCNFLHKRENLTNQEKRKKIKLNFGQVFNEMREFSRLHSIFN